MLDPSDSKQRNTLVELAWLLITLYFVWSIFGFRNFSCHHAQPPVPANEVHQNDLEHVDGMRPPPSERKGFR